MYKYLRLLPFVGMLLSLQVSAQINSPFSRFGIGQQQPEHFTVNRSMGGFSAAYRAPEHINPQNPASYTAFYQQLYRTFYEVNSRDTSIYDSTLARFVNTVVVDSIARDTVWGIVKSTSFEGAIYGNVITAQNSAESMRGGSGSLGYLALGFPVPKIGGLSFGIVPVSTVDYDILSSSLVDSAVGRRNLKFTGSGGLYKFYLGGAVQYKRLSAGVNGSFIFGNINLGNVVYFPDQPNSFGSRQQIEHHVRGLTWSGGLQYTIPVGNNELVLGAFGNPQSSVTAYTDSVWDRVLVVDDVQFPHVDTITSSLGGRNNLMLPARYGFGFMLVNRGIEEGPNWAFGADLTFEQWADVPNYLAGTSHDNSYRASAGGEYMPNNSGTYLQRVQYRLGGYYGKSPLIVKNNAVTDYGITFGLGLPLKRTRQNGITSSIDMAFQFGTMGSIQQNGLEENYFRLTVGFNLNDNNWIFKTKFY